MENDEAINDMFSLFTNIVQGLKSLWKTYPNVDLINKILNHKTRNQM